MIIKPHKNIVVMEVNWIGDILFTTPFLRALRKRDPYAHITCLVHPRGRILLENNPDINELINFDERTVHKSLKAKWQFIRHLKEKKYHEGYLLHRSLTRTALLAAAGVEKLIGFSRPKTNLLLAVKVKSDPNQTHRVNHFLKLAQAVGADHVPSDYVFAIEASEHQEADGVLKKIGLVGEGSYIVINPGANWLPKRWPWRNYAALADRLIEEFGINILITGAEKDRELAQNIMGRMENKSYSSCGVTTLKTLGSLLSRAKLVISNDSGPMHITAAVKAPLVAIFGPTDPGITGPYGTGTLRILANVPEHLPVPCYDLDCDGEEYMKRVTVDDVYDACASILKRSIL